MMMNGEKNATNNAGTATTTPPSSTVSQEKRNRKNLQQENKSLRIEVSKLESKIKQIESEMVKSNTVKSRLENLCRELQKQNKYIKEESTIKLDEAHQKGKELAAEVQSNLGFMKSVNENLAAIATENSKVKLENEEINSKLEIMKSYYEKREQIIKATLKETTDSCVAAQSELADLKLKNAEEKEKLFIEMQQLASALVTTREQMKEAKTTELQLKQLLSDYESKFNGLQIALNETNSAYESFRGEMTKASKKTRDLEKDVEKWKGRWEETQNALVKVEQNKNSLEAELQRSKMDLNKMTELCRALQQERKEMLKDLKNNTSPTDKENKKPTAVKVLTNNGDSAEPASLPVPSPTSTSQSNAENECIAEIKPSK